jgi:hypothetical protein
MCTRRKKLKVTKEAMILRGGRILGSTLDYLLIQHILVWVKTSFLGGDWLATTADSTSLRALSFTVFLLRF